MRSWRVQSLPHASTSPLAPDVEQTWDPKCFTSQNILQLMNNDRHIGFLSLIDFLTSE